MTSWCDAAPSVHAIVLTWNGWEDTERCLASLAVASYPRLEIVVVDNGSDDGTPDNVRTHFPSVRLIENRTNLGFAAGNNRGIRDALSRGADYVLVLNNDTVVEADFLEPLVDVLVRRPNVGLVSPLILRMDSEDGDRVPWFAGATVDSRTCTIVHRPYDSQETVPDGIIDTPAITGCCLLASSALFEALGGFDERFFLIFEDTDLSLRTAQAGLAMAVVADSVIRHRVSATFQRESAGPWLYYYIRNGLLCGTHLSLRSVHCRWRFVMGHLLRPFARKVVAGDFEAARKMLPGFLGLLAFILRRWGEAPQVVHRITGWGAQRS